jgi:hypothetical protein
VVALAGMLLLGACSDDGGSEAKAPTGLGPDLEELLDRCASEGDGERPCFLGVSDLSTDGGADLETVPGTRAAARELCRALIPIEPTRLVGLDAISVAEDAEGTMLSCISPSGVMVNVIRGGKQVTTPCRAGDLDEPCEEQDDGSRIWDKGGPDQPALAQQWKNGDAAFVVVGADAAGAPADKADLADDLLRATATAFALGT